ncbi:YeaC family protein [Paraferrimonas sedimenticola]|uniref:DUF1315 family protein n=1 Tax=Paraferrimonas sedimenticola TaxID=375674 RepID=A0AA37RZK2_9GAMM|nr:DUF1315 family protein [Paraferrimonas sedimenticola]GLP97938.1 hypothetical protein GCM10007895_32450 [Paraferrimonas sedimenticola]
MSDMNQVIDQMPHEVYESLKLAVELGKWADGTPLTETQKEQSMQAVILYQARRLKQTDHLTVGSDGELNHKSKAELKKQFNPDVIAQFNNKNM